MADNVTLSAGTADGAVIATDDIGGVEYQIVKLAHGALDSATIVSAASGLPANIVAPVGAGTEAAAVRVTLATDSTGLVSVDDNGGNLSIDWAGTVPPIGAGTEAAALRVTVATDSTGVVSVDDNGGNISVDWAGTVPPIGAGTEAAALRVTLATDSTGVVSVDDNGGALTVDNGGTFAVQNTPVPADKDVTTHTNYIKKYYTASAPTDGIVWSPSAGKRWHVVSLSISVDAAATVTLEDDLAGGDSAVLKGVFAAGSGIVQYFGEMYPLASGEDAADLIITCSAGNVYVTCTGYEI